MPKLILTRGIPASGKSTWAKSWVQEDPDKRVRINRDDLRRMLYGAGPAPLTWAQEQNITSVERTIAKIALEKGKNVVIDATNLRDRWARQWFTLGYPVEFRDFEVALEVAIVRNEERGYTVPAEVIKRMYTRLTDNGKLRSAPVDETLVVEPYAVDHELPWALIVDIDGTLAHIPEGGRSPYDYSRVSEDLIDESVARMVNDLSERYWVIIMSGREDWCRDDTVDWLRQNNVHFDSLHMRATGDGRRDSSIKAELFDAHVRGKYNVLGVIDDRNQVVRMWRDLGLKCFQAQEGAF